MFRPKQFPFKIPYDAEAIEAIKTIPGRRWDKINKSWWCPCTEIYTVAEVLKDFFPNIARRLLSSPRYEEAREVADTISTKIEASCAADSNFDVPRPVGLEYYPFQRAGVAYALHNKDTYRGVIIGDEMGLGKTLQAIGIMNCLLGDYHLVVCPAHLKMNWQREIRKWKTFDLPVIVLDSQTSPRSLPDKAGPGIYIINYDIIGKFVNSFAMVAWDTMTMDEAQYIKNPKSKRSELTLFLCNYAKFRTFLTGTPVVNRPVELWPMISTLDPQTWNSYWAFVRRYCGAYSDGYGYNVNGASNLGELQDKLRGTIMVRRLKSEVLKELPPKRRTVIEISSIGKEKFLRAEKAAQEKMQKMLKELEELKAKQTDVDDATAYKQAIAQLTQHKFGAFSELSRIRHETALAKVPDVINFVKDILENKDKVVVFVHHRDVAAAMFNAFKHEAVMIMGGMTPQQKDQAEQAFQKNSKIRVLVGGIIPAGTGLTLTASDTVVFAELDWVPGNIAQCEDRCHRITQNNMVMIYHVVLENSLDAKLANHLIEKQEVIDQAVNMKPK